MNQFDNPRFLGNINLICGIIIVPFSVYWGELSNGINWFAFGFGFLSIIQIFRLLRNKPIKKS